MGAHDQDRGCRLGEEDAESGFGRAPCGLPFEDVEAEAEIAHHTLEEGDLPGREDARLVGVEDADPLDGASDEDGDGGDGAVAVAMTSGRQGARRGSAEGVVGDDGPLFVQGSADEPETGRLGREVDAKARDDGGDPPGGGEGFDLEWARGVAEADPRGAIAGDVDGDSAGVVDEGLPVFGSAEGPAHLDESGEEPGEAVATRFRGRRRAGQASLLGHRSAGMPSGSMWTRPCTVRAPGGGDRSPRVRGGRCVGHG